MIVVSISDERNAECLNDTDGTVSSSSPSHVQLEFGSPYQICTDNFSIDSQ
jgi:hypothetical protein